MKKEEYLSKYNEDDTVGWTAINGQLATIYEGIEPRHYGPLCGLHFAAGGTDPIDGISVYENNHEPSHLHLVSYGMSELYYNPEMAESEFSKWGF